MMKSFDYWVLSMFYDLHPQLLHDLAVFSIYESINQSINFVFVFLIFWFLNCLAVLIVSFLDNFMIESALFWSWTLSHILYIRWMQQSIRHPNRPRDVFVERALSICRNRQRRVKDVQSIRSAQSCSQIWRNFAGKPFEIWTKNENLVTDFPVAQDVFLELWSCVDSIQSSNAVVFCRANKISKISCSWFRIIQL